MTYKAYLILKVIVVLQEFQISYNPFQLCTIDWTLLENFPKGFFTKSLPIPGRKI